MLKASKHQSPRVINVDQNRSYPLAVEELKEEGVLSIAAQLRRCKYLNNVTVQVVSPENCGPMDISDQPG
jgi:transposase-like protein